MQRDEVHKGLLVRLLTDYSNVPTGTWATVDSTGIMRDDVWWFTVKWHPYTPISTKFPRDVTEYSLNLWEKNLPLFEIVTAEQQEAARRLQPEPPPSSTLAPLPKLGLRRTGRGLIRNASLNPNQLSLFLSDDL